MEIGEYQPTTTLDFLEYDKDPVDFNTAKYGYYTTSPDAIAFDTRVYNRVFYTDATATIDVPPLETGLVASNHYVGSSMEVPFISSAIFNEDNVFRVQLSSPAGDFATFTELPTLLNQTNSLTVGIPVDTESSSTYRVRVVSSDPAIEGTPNPSDITISFPLTEVYYGYRMAISEIKDQGMENVALATYPNPATDRLTVRGASAQPGYIQLYNTQGQLIRQLPTTGRETVVDVSDLAANLYVVHLVQGQHRQNKLVQVSR